MEVGLLGPVEVSVDGQAVGLPGTTLRTLLARLALSPGRVVSTSELVAALWAENPPVDAAGNLQSYLSRLRRVIGRERVLRAGAGYRLRVAPDEVDVGRVTALVARARGTSQAVAVSRLAAALNVWRGEPLADVAGNVAFAADVIRLVEWRAQLLAEWLQARLALEPVNDVLPDLERAARAHPMRERLQLLLMQGLHADGRPAEALAVADAYRRLLADESGLDPGPALTGLAQRILAEDARPTWPRPRRRHAPRDRFVGRSRELDRLWAGAPGLVTITGPGGAGKTRLAQELLDGLADPDDAHLVALDGISTGVATAVAATLGLRAAPDGAASTIADRIGAQPVWLVLDNCEHVLDEARRLAAGLVARCPHLRLVATSRQRLGVAGEQVLRLGSLDSAEQVTLFCDRAALLRADFSAPSPRAVAEVCALVDGLPLGVELAAGREAVFGLRQLRERLAGGLGVLDPAAGGDRTTALAATVEWSYRLLAPAARALFDRLVICRGGFGVNVLEFVAPGASAGALLAELVEASMVVADVDADPPRYRVLETMRRTGLDHLNPEQRDRARDAHARWMQAHIDAVRGLQDMRSPRTTPLLRRERVNLAEALSRLVERGSWERAGRLAAPLAVALSDDPDLTLLARLAELAAVPHDAGADAALCLVAAGAAAWLQGETDAAMRLLSAALRRLPVRHPQRWAGHWFRAMSHLYAGDAGAVTADTAELLAAGQAPRWVLATAVCNAALISLFTGDRCAADAWLRDHEELLAEIGAVDGFIAYTRGELAAEAEPERALSWFDLAHRRNDEHGIPFNREVAGVGRAAVLLRMGRHEQARATLRSLIDALRRIGMWPQLWITLRLSAELLLELDDPEPAATLLAAADSDPLAPAVVGPHRARLDRLWQRIGPETAQSVATAPPPGRPAAVELALAALDRHR